MTGSQDTTLTEMCAKCKLSDQESQQLLITLHVADLNTVAVQETPITSFPNRNASESVSDRDL